tara:strand:+ start:479 stop:814 length:336 start_codon:yes stop_codon:yes gene_type:complete
MLNSSQSITLPENDNNQKQKEKEPVKKERKKNAIKLPSGLTQEMMKTYVVYYKEVYNKEKGSTREYFKVEKHPKLNKAWISSKSNKIPLLEKLKEANKVVDDLSKDKIEYI